MRGHAEQSSSSELDGPARARPPRPPDVTAGLLALQRGIGNQALTTALTVHEAHGPLPEHVVQRGCCAGCDSGEQCAGESGQPGT